MVVVTPNHGLGDGAEPPSTRYARAPSDAQYKPDTPVLYIERVPFSGEFILADRIIWEHVTIRHDGGDTTMSIVAPTDAADLTGAGELGDRHLVDLLALLHPDKRVRLVEPEPSKRVIFDGYPQTRGIAWSARSQGASATAQDRMEVWLDEARECQVYGRWMRKDPNAGFIPTNPDIRLVPALPLHFNPGGKPNRTPAEVIIDDQVLYLFTDDTTPRAFHRTVAQAIGYLIHFYVVAADRVPIELTQWWDDYDVLRNFRHNPVDPDRFRRRMTARMPDMRLDAVSLREALVTICASAGLHVRYPIEAGEDDDGNEVWRHTLRFYVSGRTGVDDPDWQMRQPAALDLPREPPHTAVTGRTAKSVAQANVIEQASFTFDHQAVNQALALGGIEYYEVTLDLVPGWLPFKLIDDGEGGQSYGHYPDFPTPLDANDQPINVLDDVTQDADSITAAKLWWDDLVRDAMDDVDSTRHAHPMHGGNVRLNKTVFDVGRLWIFPTDVRRGMLESEDVSAWQRDQHFYHPQLDCEAIDLEEFEGTGLYRLSLPTPGGGLAIAANWVSRARPMRDLSADIGSGGKLPARVEVSWNAGIDWVDVSDRVGLLEHECGIRFKPENLTTIAPDPRDRDLDNMIHSIIDHNFRVRVTCLIAGDDRIEAHRAYRTVHKTRRTVRTYDVGEKFRLRDLESGNSVYREGREITEDWQFKTIDDRQALADWLGVQGDQVSGEVVSGNPDIPWLELGIEPGDLITGIRGIGIDFPTPAEVAGIRLTREGHKTTIQMTDFRDDADVEQGALG